MINIALVDDHTLFRAGMLALLETQPEFKVALQAGSGEEFLRLLNELPIDLVLLDLRMGEGINGIETTEQLKRQGSSIRIIILSEESDPRFISHLYAIGADGYLMKNAESDEIFKAIHHVHNHGSYINSVANEAILNAIRSGSRKKPDLSALNGLTEREIEVICLLCDELTSEEIASTLFIAKSTVDNHRQRIMEKTGAKNLVGLVKYAIKQGLYPI